MLKKVKLNLAEQYKTETCPRGWVFCFCIYREYTEVEPILILFENQIQTTSASPYRTQVQLAARFLVCSLIFIEYKLLKDSNFCTIML